MTTIGFYEARTHLSELLDQVARGRQVLITRRGKPVAVLGPPPPESETSVKEIIRQMRELRRGNVLGADLTVRSLVEEGRRF